ncbi:MAG: hypothetical protein OHK0029_11650 [Armatimonadaceae bacterium]
MTCARHPKVETALQCARCATPICPDCAVSGAVGMLCPNCASNRSTHVYQIETRQLILAAMVGIVAGVVTGYIIHFLSGVFFYLSIVIGPAIGGWVGDLVWRVAGRKRGLVLELIAGGSIIFGSAAVLLFTGSWLSQINSPLWAGIYLLSIGLTVAAAVGKIRFFS